MTQNQINYQNFLETQRSNKSKEHETNRSNVAREQETYRSNVEREREAKRSNLTNEALSRDRLAEDRRSHLVTEAETERSNRARELENNRSNLAKELENNRANLARESETHRANLAQESLTADRNRITEETARYSADQGYAGRTDSAYINQYGVSPTTVKRIVSDVGSGIKTAAQKTNESKLAKTIVSLPLAVGLKAVTDVTTALGKTIYGGKNNGKETKLH